jgi:RHS repeat-associated protein
MIPPVNNLTLTNTTLSGTYQAQNQITTETNVSVTGAAVLKAGNTINLKPGFTASSGCNLTISVGAVTSDKYYYLKDHLGSIRVVVDTVGEIVSYTDYDPWGMILNGRSSNFGFANDKYKFTGKERDTETNYDYFGARYYDSDIGRFLSGDRFYFKYPSLSPYHYAGNNPLRYIDINGDSLDLAGNKDKALRYIHSLVDEKYSGLITVNSDGRVSFNTDGVDISSDAALTLLNNLINGDEKFLFEVLASNANVDGALRSDGPKGKTGDIISLPFDGVANYSITARNANGGTGNAGLLPRNGYAGQVSLGEGSYTFLDGTPQPTSNIVFHELSENYYRTNGGYPYRYSDTDPRVGAHFRAIINANKFHKQVGPAGQGNYVK